MEIVYRLIVLYFMVHMLLHIFGRKRIGEQIGAVVIVVLFVLRLLLIK